MRSHFMGSHSVEAVIMVEDILVLPPEAIVAARSYFTGPVVLFEGRTPTSHGTLLTCVYRCSPGLKSGFPRSTN